MFQVKEVGTDPRLISQFLAVPVQLHRDIPQWIRPLDKDIEDVFNPATNKLFRQGEACRWVLLNDGQPVGRIAAFIDKKIVNKNNAQPTGGCGFFECINDQAAANQLFDAARNWLAAREMQAMDGPINFGDRDRWWGLLITGYDHEPNYGCNYNPPYYKQLFETYGFREYYQQYTYGRKVNDPVSDKIWAKAERVAKDPAYRFEHMDLKQIDRYAEDFRTVYNKAWGRHAGVAAMPAAQAKLIMAKLRPVIDPRIVWFGYYNNDPIAFFIMLPELNQVFKHVNGKLDLIGKLKFVWYRRIKGLKKMFGVAFGVVPEFQGKGVEGALVAASARLVQNNPRMSYTDFEMNWIGSFNPKMMHVAEDVGGRVHKVHATYRFLFNPDQEWVPMPSID